MAAGQARLRVLTACAGAGVLPGGPLLFFQCPAVTFGSMKIMSRSFVSRFPAVCRLRDRLPTLVWTVAAVVLMVVSAGASCGQTLVLRQPAIDHAGDELQVRLGIDLRDVNGVAAALKDGVSREVSCSASLFRVRQYWFDSRIGQKRYTWRMGYDALSGEFVIRDGQRGRELRGADLAALLKTAWASVRMPLGRWALLQRGTMYNLDMAVTMHQTEVPGWVTRTLFFWDWNQGPSTSYALEFRY